MYKTLVTQKALQNLDSLTQIWRFQSHSLAEIKSIKELIMLNIVQYAETVLNACYLTFLVNRTR